MTKADIVDIIAEATGLTKVETEAVIDGFLSTIKNALREGERVEFRGFGSFSVKKRMPKKARNPGTGEVVYLPERYVPTFKASKLLKELVTENLTKKS
ncbi:MAG: integration host factor subunit beta [Candidatus Marinimicrobia bacterium]|nr:integration host factor subunit beta [Candidatus Neomarinimicrobiota bacterium]